MTATASDIRQHGEPETDDRNAHAGLLQAMMSGVGAVVAAVAVAVRILAAAAYDPETALAMVSSAGQVTVVVGALLATLPYVALAVLLFVAPAVRRPPSVDGVVSVWVEHARTGRATAVAGRSPSGVLPQGTAWSVALLCGTLLVFTAPWWLTVAGVVLFGVIAALNAGSKPDSSAEASFDEHGARVHVRSRMGNARRRAAHAGRVLRVVIRAVAMLLLAGAFLVRTDVWTPTEDIAFADRPPLTGYVLSVDDRWATILRYNDRQVLRVRTDTIRSRQVCRLRQSPVETRTTVWKWSNRLMADWLPVISTPTYPTCSS